uniref:RNA-directed DNA polymerase, eukaryota, reverse transcriptase zinc-binding domain protein n=1 Tax=Tanacetum cinerariifolium TaxID=118510 RepID=A0A6L2MUF0_TANCI|nr:RNA-directed DNA polymerase, eukaryota, reverse transcriptase zinc-binding domain protein [Tanacetum cinerariifolium]
MLLLLPRKRLCIKTSIGDNIFESFKIIVKDVNDDALSENGKEDSYSEADIIPETVFEKGKVKSSNIKEKSNEVQQEAQSEDPFKIYDLFKTKHPVSNVARQYEDEPMYPPGFTPCDNSVNIDSSFYRAKIHQKESSEKENGSKTCFKEDVNASVCSGHFKKAFDSFVADTWRSNNILESNVMLKLIKKLKLLKGCIRTLVHDKKERSQNLKKCLKNKLSDIDISLDKGEATSAMLDERLNIMNDLTSLKNNVSLELTQKAKIKWAIESDEISNSFHGIIDKHRNNLMFMLLLLMESGLRSLMLLKMNFFLTLRSIQLSMYWSLIEDDVLEVVKYFFQYGYCHKGANSSFFALISKIPGAKMVKDFRPISLIRSLYKNISKLLANRLVTVMSDLVNEVQSAFIANRVLDYFFRASGLCINLHKSKLIGIAVDQSMVEAATSNIGCMALNLPFSYLRIIIGGNMSRIKVWDDVINKFLCRLSKWKMKILSIGGRFTLLKSVLGASPIYFMTMFNAPIQVLKKLEYIRNHFFIGVDSNVRKMMLIKWDNVLASKEKGGLGVLSFYALNRALTFKWIWRFCTQGSSLWSRVINLIHGEDGKIGKSFKHENMSNWNNNTRGITLLQNNGIDLLVENKMVHSSLASSLRRNPRGSIEQVQMANLISNLEGFTLPNMHDRRRWSLSGDGEFLVASVRNLIDDRTLAEVGAKTHWIKYVSIKVNILAWRIKLNNLPSRLNLSRRGLDLDTIFVPLVIRQWNLAITSSLVALW